MGFNAAIAEVLPYYHLVANIILIWTQVSLLLLDNSLNQLIFCHQMAVSWRLWLDMPMSCTCMT